MEVRRGRHVPRTRNRCLPRERARHGVEARRQNDDVQVVDSGAGANAVACNRLDRCGLEIDQGHGQDADEVEGSYVSFAIGHSIE